MSAAKHTPGPWRWEINESSKTVALVGGVPRFDLTVMDFVRYGMGGAAPRLRDLSEDGMNIMHRAETFAVVVPGREHHANWFKDLSHGDASLIAAAPDLLAALQGMIDAHAVPSSGCNERPPYEAAIAAVVKATGSAK